MNERPDPDALLSRVQAEEARASRGKLRVFFGFAPGVGKTYRMLQAARDLVTDQRVDVVVGLVETHRRRETAAMMLGLPLLARKRFEHRGHVLEELDLDAALARRPAVLLVDELAHTNAPGSRHPKRWQDVEELLDAGIDVFTTVNVQHVESLNDVVAQITHIQVRETVPDAIIDRADAIEVVDISPEELLSRLHEGKVYLEDQARRAAGSFFRRGNLLALRELALRRTAQRVDEDVLQYRADHGVSVTWPAGERILVCVGPAPSSMRLIRAAARMAGELHAPWIAAYAEPPSGRVAPADRDRLEAHLRLAEGLGATVARLSSGRTSEAILDYARRHNVTRIVIGKPTHSRLRDLVRGSLLDEVVRGSGEIEVQVISGVAGDARDRGDRGDRGHGAAQVASGERSAQESPPRPWPYIASLSLVAVTTGLGWLLHRWLAVPDLEVLFLLAVMLAAIRFGRGPSLAASIASIAAYDFFFVPPYFTFAVADARYFLTFTMMFGVGLVVSELTTRLRSQETEARNREARTSALYALSRGLGAAGRPEAIADVAARQAAEVFGVEAYVLHATPEGGLELVAAAPIDRELGEAELGVARWCLEHGEPAGRGTDTLPGAKITCVALGVGRSPAGVLALALADDVPLGVEQRAFLETFSRQVGLALERVKLADEARAAAVRAKTEETRSALLSAVSHDLRTPLGAITGAASSLRDTESLDDATRRELVESICDEAERLERLVANLLDMTRLESGAIALKREWVPLDELVGSALTRLEPLLERRAVRTTIPADLPLLSVDPVLFSQVFVNLFENAAKYTPGGTPIEVTAHREPEGVVIDVDDHGPGIPPGDEERVFEKFHRGAHGATPGAGLGLAICRGIAEVHGGSIRAGRAPGGGARFTVVVPLLGEPPLAAEAAP